MITKSIRDLFLSATLAVVVICAVSGSSYSQRMSTPHFGSITGRVLDETGKPGARAKVSLTTTGPSTGGYDTVADSSGHFVFAEVQAGRYRVTASRDENGYRDISWIFFNLIPPWTVEVSVTEHYVSRGIVVRMYSKKAKLTGSLLDAETRQPIKDATLFLCRQDRNSCVGVNNDLAGRFRVLVPSIPLRVRAYAPGYQDWYYGPGGSKEHSETLRLEPNTIKELTIPLRRSR